MFEWAHRNTENLEVYLNMWLGEPASPDWELQFAPMAREHVGAPLSAGSSTDVPGDAAQRGRREEPGRGAEAREPGREPCDSQDNGFKRPPLYDLYAPKKKEREREPRQETTQERLWAEINEEAAAYIQRACQNWMQRGCPMETKGFPRQSAEQNDRRQKGGQAATPAESKTFAQRREEEEGGLASALEGVCRAV